MFHQFFNRESGHHDDSRLRADFLDFQIGFDPVQTGHPVFLLSTAVRKQFGEELLVDSEFFTTRPNGVATLESETADRAEASYLETNGVDATLYLIKIRDNWWVSGLTYVHTPFPARSATQMFPDFDEHATTISFVAPEFRKLVESGRFSSIEEFRSALAEMLEARERGR